MSRLIPTSPKREDIALRKNRDFSAGPVWNPELRRWLVEFMYPDQTRKRRRFRRQRDAQLWWADQHRAVEAGTWNQSLVEPQHQKRSFGDLCDEYRKWAQVNLRSYKNYIAVGLKFWEAKLGRDCLLDKITPRWIETVKSDYAQNVEQATVDRKLEVLRSMFNWAISQGSFGGPNPMRGVKLFKPNNEIVRYLAAREYVAVLEAANQERWYVRPVIELAANTGLRKRNILRLRWDECDLETGVIRITRTKSKKTVTIPMTEATRTVLEKLLEKTGRSSFVFCHLEGEQAGLPIADIKKSWKAVLKAAGITRPFRFHDLRHSCASQLVMNGASLMAVKEILGHESLKTTLRYAHLSPEYVAQEVKVLDRALPKVCHPDASNQNELRQSRANRKSSKSLTLNGK
jgi:integrase